MMNFTFFSNTSQAKHNTQDHHHQDEGKRKSLNKYG